ncbi:UDP-N-acetylmuramoyl-L-alanyl-D-glutamate--2,6-diaminopimelate ligase [Iodidimonas sp. SYSU 1G8]|uniref:UDP-N-acetylmuramoyl-L-alanyl-D-glutamate--2, 6-diaminopimelate ligase n=1 Tax=Iodidimonas sp. SYSU 1G8 TaxID=3133967 RepID=UPI0031FF30F1
MRLSDLIGGNGAASGIEIQGLSCDSRTVSSGYLFAALAGTRARGADFVAQAIERGAVAVLAEPDVAVPAAGVYLVPDVNPRRRLAHMAARFFAAQPETVVAVTGTNGKSSVADFVRQIWARAGLKSGSMGTLGVRAAGMAAVPTLTTPDPIEIHARLADMKRAGVEHVAIEASSHGLAQYRLDGVKLKAAAFTNLSRDHLDYHADYDDYFLAKLRLFGEVLQPGAVAVLNTETHVYEELVDICWGRGLGILSVGDGGELRIVSRTRTARGQELDVRFEKQRFDISLPLIGDFQASNALVAAALVIGTGGDVAETLAALEYLEPVPGRLQTAGRTQAGAAIYVDYAHTPDALRTLLETLRPYTESKLHVVFGCGGDRDKGKRPQMGEIAIALADRVIVTDDNPRGEDAARIRADILAAAPGAVEIADRQSAISAAVAALAPGDVLAVAGKGHEQGQIVGDTVLPFDDVEAVRVALGGARG